MRALRNAEPMLGILYLLLTILLIPTTLAKDTKYVVTTDSDGDPLWLADDRKPALYTQNFGDCLGSSTINVTRFDAAYYKDNMTVLFHLEGNTAVTNESMMSKWDVRSGYRPTPRRLLPAILVGCYGLAEVESTSGLWYNSSHTVLTNSSVPWSLCLWRTTI